MKVAVTGATGFLGRHVVPALLARGANVVAAARNPGEVYAAGPGLELATINLRDPEGAVSALGQPEVLLHLAWEGLPNYKSDVHLLEELPRQISFLDACKRSGIRRLVVAGTCLEYGMREGELDEMMPVAPTTAYGHAKDQLHQHLEREAVTGRLDLTWLRIFYLFGPGQAKSSLYSQLKNAVESGAHAISMSPGDQLRDFLPVETAAAHMGTLALQERGAGTVNICSGAPIDVAGLARAWLRSWGSKLYLDLGVLPYPDYEPHEFWGSAKKLNATLGAS